MFILHGMHFLRPILIALFVSRSVPHRARRAELVMSDCREKGGLECIDTLTYCTVQRRKCIGGGVASLASADIDPPASSDLRAPLRRCLTPRHTGVQQNQCSSSDAGGVISHWRFGKVEWRPRGDVVFTHQHELREKWKNVSILLELNEKQAAMCSLKCVLLCRKSQLYALYCNNTAYPKIHIFSKIYYNVKYENTYILFI